MIARLNKVMVMLIITACLLVMTSYAEEAKMPIKIAILPCRDVVKTFENFQPLANYLKQEIGRGISIVVPKDFVEFERVINEGKVDFAFQAPHSYVRLSHLYNGNGLLKALTPDGEIFHRGVIIARKDSGISKVEDLKGKVMLFGPKLSTLRWVAVRLLLEEKGIDIDRDLRRYSHGKCCESIALNVYLKAADAGTLCDYSFKDLVKEKEAEKEGMDPEQLITIGKTRPIPTWVFAARKDVDIKTVADVNSALLKLDKDDPRHKRLLEGPDLGGFIKAKDEDYNVIRNLIKQKGGITQ